MSATQASGSAGRRGVEVRSDLWVSVEQRQTGGFQLELTSRVETYYGDAIRRQVVALLRSLGLEHAGVEIEDTGALPFVIAARVEAAVRGANGSVTGDGRPPRTASTPPPSERERMRRSRLYLPGNEPKYFVNAGLYGADGIILDLEDSVHPEAKDAARILVRNALRCVDFGSAERMVRINPLPLGLADLAAVIPEQPDLILIPKVEGSEQIREVERVLEADIDPAGTNRPIWLMPILESALGIEHAFEIAGASPRVAGLTLGLEDLAADLGVPRSAGGIESRYARERVILAARAAGVQAIDSVYSQVDDLAGLESWATESRQLGFGGMGCLHPRQIEVIHTAFNPRPDELLRARRIVEAFDRAQAAGLGVVSLGSKMIDPPVVRQAQRLVERARLLGLPDPEPDEGTKP